MMQFEHWLEACQALSDDCAVRMRKPGDWYVDHRGVEIKNGSVLEGRYGNGKTPMDAVADHWKALTELKPNEYVVVGAMATGTRRAVRWNGFMWADVRESSENGSGN